MKFGESIFCYFIVSGFFYYLGATGLGWGLATEGDKVPGRRGGGVTKPYPLKEKKIHGIHIQV